MRIKTFMTAASLAALAACGSSDNGKGNGSATATAPAGGGTTVKLQPGEWEMTMETLNVDAPGMPPQVAAAMKKQQRASSRDCMTPEEAEGPKAEMFKGADGANCKQEGFVWSGGRIQGTTTCTGEKGVGKVSMTMAGQYSPTSMDVTMKMVTEAAGTPMTIETRMTGRRIGECPAGKAG